MCSKDLENWKAYKHFMSKNILNRNLHVKIARKRTEKSLFHLKFFKTFDCKCLKLSSKVLKDLPEVQTSELSQLFCKSLI